METRMLGLLLMVVAVSMASHDSATPKTYEGDKVLAVSIKDISVWKAVQNILEKFVPTEDRDIWSEPTARRPAYIRVPLARYQQVSQALHTAGIDFEVSIDNVNRLITKVNNENELKVREARSKGKRSVVGTYARYDEIQAWMADLAATYPEIVSHVSIGKTYEGRWTSLLKLGLPGDNKWRVWIDAGFHAREWVAPSTAIYIADQLIQGYMNNNTEVMEFLRVLDFHILPVANPDGYEYCHTTERLWRKNRRPYNATCTGVDLNRNFAFEWGGANADPNPCGIMYLGEEPESEPEVINVVNHIMPEASKFIMYLSYHSWGQQFFTRWDYTADVVPPDHEELLALAWDAVNAINAVHGQDYEAGTAPVLMYPFSGSSADWSRGTAGIKYPYLMELRDNGEYAFVLPPEQIIPCGEENWAGVKVLLNTILANYGGISPS